MENENIIRTLIADDHSMFVEGLKSLLKLDKQIHVVADAMNGTEAYNMICKHTIDLLITDISMPEMNGIELTKKVKKEFPNVKVLVLSMHNDREIVSEILMAEADGYILKNARKHELLNAIHKIANNSTYYCNEILSIMMEKIKKETKVAKEVKELSARELEIIKLIMQEFSSEEIANTLSISKNTVDTHRKNILEKIKVKTVVGLCKFAFRNHLD
ncbi:MAG: response regulator [Bacteroidia bacterium]